jgi:hypothetical protein
MSAAPEFFRIHVKVVGLGIHRNVRLLIARLRSRYPEHGTAGNHPATAGLHAAGRTAYAGPSCDPQVGCATLRDGALAIFVAYDQCCCYNGSGNLDDGVISLNSADSGCSGCGPYRAKFVEVTGSLGSRTLKLSIDGKTVRFAETSDPCSCATLLG